MLWSISPTFPQNIPHTRVQLLVWLTSNRCASVQLYLPTPPYPTHPNPQRASASNMGYSDWMSANNMIYNWPGCLCHLRSLGWVTGENHSKRLKKKRPWRGRGGKRSSGVSLGFLISDLQGCASLVRKCAWLCQHVFLCVRMSLCVWWGTEHSMKELPALNRGRDQTGVYDHSILTELPFGWSTVGYSRVRLWV